MTFMKFHLLARGVTALLLAAFFFSVVSMAKAEDARRIKVLLLGDKGHHQPAARAQQIVPVLFQRGIDVIYTEDIDIALSKDTLKNYDCFAVFANIDSITADQEKALLEFVEEGKGFVPIHCASYCFRNATKVVALTGAQFLKHGTGVFKETITQPDHPIMKGLAAIESWDETYVHHKHNDENRIVLAVREDKDGKEPWTWIRTQGKGRVFYTAWGHDQRTWSNEGFQKLLERGIRWSAGDWALALEAPKPKAFEFKEADLPNYLAGGAWGKQGDRLNMMQQPISPEESMKHMLVPGGFEVKLFASDPQIKKPICMTWDERGRLYIAETIDYPNEMQREGEGRDRITMCEDTDGDGKADKFTVFADKLSIPTSMVRSSGGLIVTQAPHTLFLKDTDGDDKADERKILFTGWGTGDTHAGPSNLRYGLDNWIYGTVGYSGFNGTIGGVKHQFGSGVYRFKPDGSSLEFLASTNNNTWGLTQTEEGHILGSTANGNAMWYLHIPNRYYESVRGWSAKRTETIADSQVFHAITDKVRQVDHHGKYTAAAGSAIYTARAFPKEYWNRIAFVAEPTGHIVGRFALEAKGSDFIAKNQYTFFGSQDEWTSPIAAEVGPDGAVWMIDWYNYIIQHNPTPAGFKNGKGNAYETPVRDKRHGRIYRIVYKDGTPSKQYDLSKATPEQLVEVLKSDNMFWRLHAQRLIVESKGTRSLEGTARALDALIAKGVTDHSSTTSLAAIHALWTFNGLGMAPSTLGEPSALEAASPALRKAIYESMPLTAKWRDDLVKHNTTLRSEPDPQVRKSALLALADMPADEKAGAAIFAMLGKKENADDRWIPDAAAAAAAKHDAGFLKAVILAYPAGGRAPSLPLRFTSVNLLANASFEEAVDGKPKGWSVRTYGGEAKHALDKVARTGTSSLRIDSAKGSDTSWFADVQVAPNTNYRLSAWIKTQGVKSVNKGMGALLNVHNINHEKTKPVLGDSDWTYVDVVFNSGNQTTLSINCLFGGWGLATGTAWYDDIELVVVGPQPVPSIVPGTVGRVTSIVTTNYAQRGPTESVMALLKALGHADDSLRRVMIDALATGWPANKAPTVSDADKAMLVDLLGVLPADTQARFVVLADRWGRRDLFAAALAQVTDAMRKAVADEKGATANRIAAAKRLIGLDDTAASAKLILAPIKPQSDADLAVALVTAMADSKSDDTGGAILAQWKQFTPAPRRAAVTVMLRRAPWAKQLLEAIKADEIPRGDLAAEHWQQLSLHADKSIASLAKELNKVSNNVDRQKIYQAMLPHLNAKGDIKTGEAIFTKTCAQCHTFEGKGGQVGPPLTGIGARDPKEILAEIIDPNRSLEANFRLWTITTTEGDIISGRLDTESRTTIEILDTQGKRHVIQRADIDDVNASVLSIMPPGLIDMLKPHEVSSLMQYLMTSKHK